MTALSQDTHFLSFRKQQIAIPSGKQRMTLSIPEKCKYFCLYQSSEDAPTYGSEGGLYVTTTISTFVPENKQIEIRQRIGFSYFKHYCFDKYYSYKFCTELYNRYLNASHKVRNDSETICYVIALTS